MALDIGRSALAQNLDLKLPAVPERQRPILNHLAPRDAPNAPLDPAVVKEAAALLRADPTSGAAVVITALYRSSSERSMALIRALKAELPNGFAELPGPVLASINAELALAVVRRQLGDKADPQALVSLYTTVLGQVTDGTGPVSQKVVEWTRQLKDLLEGKKVEVRDENALRDVAQEAWANGMRQVFSVGAPEILARAATNLLDKLDRVDGGKHAALAERGAAAAKRYAVGDTTPKVINGLPAGRGGAAPRRT